MAERKKLLEIYNLLQQTTQQNDVQPIDKNTDLEVLQAVVDLIKSKDIARSLDDSLAFPFDVREKINFTRTQQFWNELDKLDNCLRQDYKCRRLMLLRRLDCTVESFKWKRGTKKNDGKQKEIQKSSLTLNEQIHGVYDKIRTTMRDDPEVTIADLLASRCEDCDQLLNEVVSSRKLDCEINFTGSGPDVCGQTNLKHVVIPNVPDRGGRTDEIMPPVKETTGFQSGVFRNRRRK